MAVKRSTTSRRTKNTSLNALLGAYKRMLLIRIAEQKLVDLYLNEKIMSFVHFYIGQEAVAVGVCDNLGKEDKVLGNHRSHGHYLAKGGDLKRMICELLGKEEGCSHGKGGSMHMIDKSVNFVGSTPILGSVVPLAAGVAFEQRFHKRRAITVAFLGDGAFEEGAVLETLNLAGLFRLPLLLVVENNLYAVNSALEDRRAPDNDSKTIVTGLGAEYAKANGNDYQEVRAKASALVDTVRRNSKPAVLECVVYRHMAHSAPIFDESCRKEDVLEQRQKKDSLKKMEKELIRKGVSKKKIAAFERDTSQYVDACISYAKRSPYPKRGELYTDLYV